MIAEVYRENFETLIAAVDNGDVCIVECTEITTGKTVIVVCATQQEDNGDISLVPLAKMFDGNPYEEIRPPL